MNGLSDLELVAQAMSTAPQTTPQPQTTTGPTPAQPPANGSSNEPASAPTTGQASANGAPIDLSALPAGADPSSLTPADLSALHPLLSSLSLSPEELEALDDSQIADILAQLEAADGVADDLEGKLDRLLATLGGYEEEIVQGREEGAQMEDEGGLVGGRVSGGEQGDQWTGRED
ncbi:hypothetical protein IAT38_000285 [Cryptococcus sp. DSM 104549]